MPSCPMRAISPSVLIFMSMILGGCAIGAWGWLLLRWPDDRLVDHAVRTKGLALDRLIERSAVDDLAIKTNHALPEEVGARRIGKRASRLNVGRIVSIAAVGIGL